MKLSNAYRSLKDKAQITIKLRHFKKGVTDGEIILHYKTKHLISKTDFDKKNISLEVKQELERCSDYVLTEFYKRGENFIPTKNWFHNRCNEFFEIRDDEDLLVTSWIDKRIRYLKNNQNSINTINNYKVLKEKIKRFKEGLELTDLKNTMLDNFKYYLREEERYKIGTINKDIDHLKAVLKMASKDVQFPQDFRDMEKFKQTKQSKKNEKRIVYLTEDDIKRITDLKLDKPHLINARKWLIIGVNTGQRISELSTINKNSFKQQDGIEVIKFTQKKTGKDMTIPVLPAIKILLEETDFPYKVSDNKLNKALKQLGKLANIDTPTEAYLKEKVKIKTKDGVKLVDRKVLGIRPKYMYFITKIFRRTFSTYWIDKMPPEEVRKFTGHESNEMLYKYVAEAREDFSKWKEHLEKEKS